MKITFFVSLVLFLWVFWLSPNDTIETYLASQVNQSLSMIEHQKKEFQHESELIGVAFPQYDKYYQEALKTDSLCELAVREDWDLADLDTLLLAKLYDFQRETMRQDLSYFEQSRLPKSTLAKALKTIIFEERKLAYNA